MRRVLSPSSLGPKTFKLRGSTHNWHGLSLESPREQNHCSLSNNGREIGWVLQVAHALLLKRVIFFFKGENSKSQGRTSFRLPEAATSSAGVLQAPPWGTNGGLHQLPLFSSYGLSWLWCCCHSCRVRGGWHWTWKGSSMWWIRRWACESSQGFRFLLYLFSLCPRVRPNLPVPSELL